MKRLFVLLLLLVLTGCGRAGYSFGPPKPGDGVVTLIKETTRERLTVVYREAGFIIPPAMRQIEHLMRDNNNGMAGHIDPNLIVLLDDLTGYMGLPDNVPIIITSGYRSPMSNHDLRKKSGQVAENSYHLNGQAADIKIPNVPGQAIARAAKNMRRGGVAYYSSSHHVHVDVGPVRTWDAH